MSCQFCMLKSKLGVARFSAQGLKAKIKVLAGLCSYLELAGPHQSSLGCGRVWFLWW